VPQIVFSDKKWLSQALGNLMSNAVKFTGEQGKIQLAISMLKHEKEMVTLQFEVADNGIGISEEDQKRLFSLFEQADGSETRQFGGIGSGLFITKHIVELMSGKIEVDSKPGKGSKFAFAVDVKKAKG